MKIGVTTFTLPPGGLVFCAWFTAGFDTRDLKDAQALLLVL